MIGCSRDLCRRDGRGRRDTWSAKSGKVKNRLHPTNKGVVDRPSDALLIPYMS